MNHRQLPIDFAQCYRTYMQEIQYQEMPAEAWDQRAANMSRHALLPSAYTDAFLKQIDFDQITTVLDVGCGPGTLALKMAPKVHKVYALDYSQGMLDCLMDNACKLGLTNIMPIHLTKNESWTSHVPVCDAVVCSRAGLDHDLAALLQKFTAYARHSVYFSYLVGGRFDIAAISALMKKTKPAFPDYIYVMNILYQLGFDPELSFVSIPGRLFDCQNSEDFLLRMQQQYGDLSSEQEQLLRQFYQQNHTLFATLEFGMKWALFKWCVSDSQAVAV
ncbi:methyltransferase domain-containing protein [Neisseriaceae bacterium ESL0693]|nr:methyltransferase domain-containing protein [Neisseriaceae bacterium ESL0693]